MQFTIFQKLAILSVIMTEAAAKELLSALLEDMFDEQDEYESYVETADDTQVFVDIYSKGYLTIEDDASLEAILTESSISSELSSFATHLPWYSSRIVPLLTASETDYDDDDYYYSDYTESGNYIESTDFESDYQTDDFEYGESSTQSSNFSSKTASSESSDVKNTDSHEAESSSKPSFESESSKADSSESSANGAQSSKSSETSSNNAVAGFGHDSGILGGLSIGISAMMFGLALL
ncbi:unnamed protein product [Ambrosiozyma monospora]|uniref:Unnamed protein product n=1 Tax=Ambrosiozyma monospora TaxID=43982 RepID=A0ACB5U5Y6_AMBMO|nr:unnamed protein product [Ambrosiozyma monospora]